MAKYYPKNGNRCHQVDWTRGKEPQTTSRPLCALFGGRLLCWPALCYFDFFLQGKHDVNYEPWWAREIEREIITQKRWRRFASPSLLLFFSFSIAECFWGAISQSGPTSYLIGRHSQPFVFLFLSVGAFFFLFSSSTNVSSPPPIIMSNCHFFSVCARRVVNST